MSETKFCIHDFREGWCRPCNAAVKADLAAAKERIGKLEGVITYTEGYFRGSGDTNAAAMLRKKFPELFKGDSDER
jgi:hypothetical protein